MNSFLCSSLIYFIITDNARASLRAFFHEQIGQKRFLQELPLCCFLFSIFSSLTYIKKLSQSLIRSCIFSLTSPFTSLEKIALRCFLFVCLIKMSCFSFCFSLYLLI